MLPPTHPPEGQPVQIVPRRPPQRVFPDLFGICWVPEGRGYILTKFQLKQRHLDLIHARFDDFGPF